MLAATNASAATIEIDLATASPVPEGSSSVCAEGGWYTGDGSHRTIACYIPTGDWIQVVDQASDGYSAVALWQVTNANGAVVRQGRVYNASGYDTHRYKNKDFHDGSGYTLSIRACVGNWRGGDNPNIVLEACSAPKYTRT
ncbi:hypothetical protein [Streptomyces sp. NPDC059979]|uniref:hypothetical protein n=1 Tax=Streptomyces sp. NPDC059979 TaxID=3347021 RepID=UPI0036C2CE74